MATATPAVLAARAKWRYRGVARPPFAVAPKTGQESVWDYPRPPRIAAEARRVRVLSGESLLADSGAAVRVLETASPPTFYLPPADVARGLLQATGQRFVCEWKGVAEAFRLADDDREPPLPVAWAYLDTFAEFEALRGYVAFYPGRVRCTVAGRPVQAQPGGYYGGWITPEVVGPFKGDPGSAAWW